MPVRQRRMWVLSEHVCLEAFVCLAIVSSLNIVSRLPVPHWAPHEVLSTLMYSQWKNDLMCS